MSLSERVGIRCFIFQIQKWADKSAPDKSANDEHDEVFHALREEKGLDIQFEAEDGLSIQLMSKCVVVFGAGFIPMPKYEKIKAPKALGENQLAQQYAHAVLTRRVTAFSIHDDPCSMNIQEKSRERIPDANFWFEGTAAETLGLLQGRQVSVLFLEVSNATRESTLCRVQAESAISWNAVVVFLDSSDSKYAPEVRVCATFAKCIRRLSMSFVVRCRAG
eukprot:SAG11_NODE_6865_length_1234_cov_0.728634_2_plen_220_part_00